MSEINPNAVSLEDAQIESQPIAQPAVEPEPHATDDAEPDGVVEHQGRRMVDVSVVAAERRRARESTARAKDSEYEPLKAKAQEADQLRQALAEAQPYLNHLRQHPELLQAPKPTSREEQVSDEDAADEARDLELYDAKTGQPDLGRAKRIIARRRHDAQSAAQHAAQAAVGPITSQTAQSSSRQNFVQMAMRKDAQDQPLVDPKALANLWAQLPPELTAHPEVGELILDAAIGKSIRTTGRVQRAERAPTLSEPAGGRTGPSYKMDQMAKHLAKAAGISDKTFTESGNGYNPGQTNILGD